MQARVTCPACQTVLGVTEEQGDGVLLRCPRCRHEFAMRFRSPAAKPAPWTANDALSAPLSPQAPRPTYNRPPARLPAMQTGPGGSVLWIGIGAGAAIAAASLVLIMLVMRLAAPGDNAQTAIHDVIAAPLPAGQAPADPLAVQAPPVAVASAIPPSGGAPAGPSAGELASSPAASATSPTPPSASQPVSSIGPSSPFSAPGSAPAVPPASPVVPPASPVVPPAAPVVPPPVPPSLPPAPPLLAYRFKAGEEYAYSFNVKADLAGTAASGLCTLTVSREGAPAEFSAHQKTGHGNGSGFVVTSDGYVVTCAHVVEDSTKLEVVLGSQTYPAQVAAFDKEHDLAVVRIVAANLPTIPLANSDAVELGQEVRAAGFPMSQVLGDSIKISRGSVSGIVNTSGNKLLQVDASINPGNSGGPVVNEMGQVVGVASAKLTGADVDGVGFAVPANNVLALLRSKGISPASAAAGQKLDGPALVRRVTPAVALIKVEIGPGGYGASNRQTLDYSGHVTSSGPPRTVGRMSMPGMPSTESDRGKLLVSERGELLDSTGAVQIPYLIGPLGSLAIEPLGADSQRAWQTNRATVLTQIIGQESSSPISLRFRSRSRGRFGPSPFAQSETKVVVTPAVETSDYELTGANGDLASIRKRYTFQTVQAAGAPPIAKVTGEGTITFNRAQGHPVKMDYKATLVRTVSNVTITVPLTMEWHRLSQGELDHMHAQNKERMEAAKKAHEERMAQVAKKNIGDDTGFAGGPGGSPSRFIDETSLLYGVECEFSNWMGEQCVNKIVPIFARDQERQLPTRDMAREGYAVGAVKVYAQSHVNGVQLVYMRVRDDRRLNSKDSYTSGLLGVRGPGKATTLTGEGDPIIGIHVRRGLIIDALALVVDHDAEANAFESSKSADSPSKGASPRKSTSAKTKRR